MMRYKSIHSLKSFVRNKLSKEEFDECLQAIQDFVQDIICCDSLHGILLYIKELDALCMEVGQKLLKPTTKKSLIGLLPNPIYGDNAVIYIATQLYNSGGHTAVIEDFIVNSPKNTKHYIIFTDIFFDHKKNLILERFSKLPTKLIFLSGRSLSQKALDLQKLWLQLAPNQVFLFNHPQDSVALAAAQPAMPGRLFFYHHVDFHLCLGATLKHATHIDFNAAHLHDCSHNAGVRNIYSPLICQDVRHNLVTINKSDGMQESKIRTATSGHFTKFTKTYLYSYFSLLPLVIKATKGDHIHIGYLPKLRLAQIYYNLWKANIPLKRFIYIPWVKSVAETMLSHQVNLYITSFPIGGGRTAIEVMSAGIPIVCHQNYISIFLSEKPLVYPETFFWQTPEQLLHILNNITHTTLKQHSKFSRKHYEGYFSTKLLASQLASNFNYIVPMPASPLNSNLLLNKEQWLIDLTVDRQNLRCILSLSYFSLFSKVKNFILTLLKK